MISRITALVLILVSIAIAVQYIKPTYTEKIADEKNQIKKYDSALLAATQFNKKQNDLLAQQNKIVPADMARLKAFLPDGVDNIQLIIDLDALGARTGVLLSGYEIQTNTSGSNTSGGTTTNLPMAHATANVGGAGGPPSGLQPAGLQPASVPALQSAASAASIDVNVSVKGTYQQFRTFLAAAEQSLRPLDVIQLSVQNSTTGVYTFTVKFRMYWLQ